VGVEPVGGGLDVLVPLPHLGETATETSAHPPEDAMPSPVTVFSDWPIPPRTSARFRPVQASPFRVVLFPNGSRH